MTYVFDGYNYTIRLNKGEHLTAGMQDFFIAEPDATGTLSGIGGAQQTTLGFYDLQTKEYRWKTFNALLEVTSLRGTVAFGPDGALMFHLHGTFSDAEFCSIGGHVKDLVVGGTLELFLHRSYKPLRRNKDPEVGLNILDL